MVKKLMTGAALILPGIALAGTAFAQGIVLTNPLGGNCNDLNCVAQKVIGFLWLIAIPIASIMVLVGGFQMMTSAGDPEKFSSGKKTLTYAAIGLVVILLAGGFASFIKSLFGA